MLSKHLGKMVGEFSPKFAKAVVFGEYPSRERPSKLNNGTVSLLRLDCGPVAVTCHHVIDFYRTRVNAGEKCLFQIGQCRLNPLNQLLSENSNADLAVLALTEIQADRIVAEGSHIGSHFFTPASWPPARAAEGDDVTFCGFPGRWRETLEYDFLQFASYSGGHRVTTVGHLSFICALDHQSLINQSNYKDTDPVTAFSGMSGGPAFALRSLNFEFVGVICQYASATDSLYLTHAALIGSNGDLNL